MDTPTLDKIVVAALEDIKARDIEVINTTKLSSLFDRIIVASADSARQTKSLARSVQDKVLEAGGRVIGMEGEETGDWIVVDLRDIVHHPGRPRVAIPRGRCARDRTRLPAAPRPGLIPVPAFPAARLPAHKLPEALRVIDALPLTAMQKLDRRSLAAHEAD